MPRLLLLLPLLLQLAHAQIPPAPGQLIEAAGTRLHLHCTGTGAPTVILEAGFPGSSLDWTLVQPLVSQFTRVCSYDRAGFGWSLPATTTNPRSSPNIAQDLRALLSAAAIPPPYILAGHSMGGLYVRAFTQKFPDAVSGLVLVDATHEDQWDYEPSRFWQLPSPPAIRLKPPEIVRPRGATLILKHMWATDRWKAAEKAERQAIGLTVEHAQKQPKRLPAVPLLVLSAGEEVSWSDHAPLGVLKGQQLHKEMAAFSPLGLWRPVPGANHYIHLSQPVAVANAIREVVQSAAPLKPATPAARQP